MGADVTGVCVGSGVYKKKEWNERNVVRDNQCMAESDLTGTGVGKGEGRGVG